MAISNHVQQVVLLLVCFLVAVTFRCIGIHRHKQEIFFIIGSFMVVIACGTDVIYFAVMVGGSCCLIKSAFINSPRLIFAFCCAVKLLFDLAETLGLSRAENSLGRSLMMLTVLKMIVVTYEIVEFRRGKKENESPSKCAFGVLSLEKEPSALDLICYMTQPFGLFTGPICKYRTYSDMLKQQNYAPLRKRAINCLLKFLLMLMAFLYLMQYRTYFTSQRFLTDPLLTRLLYVYLIGLHYQTLFATAWLFSELICAVIGLGTYPASSKPQPMQGPTVEFRKSKPNESLCDGEEEMDFTTVRNIEPMELLNPSFSRSIQYWNMCVQWWLVHFVYRSDLIPRRMKLLRFLLVFFVSALWHGLTPGFLWVMLQLPFVMAMDEACLSVQRNCISGYWKKRLYLAFHLIFFKTFGHHYFISAFQLVTVDDQSVWNFFRLTYFAGLLVPLVITLMCGVIRLFSPGRNKNVN